MLNFLWSAWDLGLIELTSWISYTCKVYGSTIRRQSCSAHLRTAPAMATKSTYIIAVVDCFCITGGLISKTENILRLYKEWRLYYCRHHCDHTPLSRETRIRYVPRTEVGFGGGKENVLDSENFYAKDIL